jgi:AcrR family transcriptional regulator
MGDSRIKGRILQAAIQLFGNFGFGGVTTRGIAKMAQCMEGGIYRLYGDKAGLYEEVVATVVEATLNSMATFALKLYTETSGRMDRDETIKAAVHCWYWSMSLDGAKLMQQVLLHDKPHEQQVRQPFANVLAILQKTLESDVERPLQGFDSTTRIECLIWALFHLKLTHEGPADKERLELDRFLQDWLQTVPSSDKSGHSNSGSSEFRNGCRTARK